ncbi:hypothetical protein LZL87_013526 [Fusarium oxysporum]|uniref:Uncharacterized protein n=1 Tax=Fusarium oxysporum f. sp. rapae TaxID=485398 RepID=A0A8J5NTQ9_FUSOX|nr:hypothetical protein Forpe1208_v010994 [Fusarium oxysporum f. sp. rapae]KAI7765347.1 hypothetical protein LZL87_013526 [Fusarium oxysporum]
MRVHCSPSDNNDDYPAAPCATCVSWWKTYAATKKAPSIPPTSLSTPFLAKCILDAYALRGVVHVVNMDQYTELEGDDDPSTVPWVADDDDDDRELCDYEVVAVDGKRYSSLSKDQVPDKNPRTGGVIDDKVAIHCLKTVETHRFTVLAWRPKMYRDESMPFMDREAITAGGG